MESVQVQGHAGFAVFILHLAGLVRILSVRCRSCLIGRAVFLSENQSPAIL